MAQSDKNRYQDASHLQVHRDHRRALIEILPTNSNPVEQVHISVRDYGVAFLTSLNLSIQQFSEEQRARDD